MSFKSIQSLMDLRHEGDYQDFAVITEEEANGAVDSSIGIGYDAKHFDEAG